MKLSWFDLLALGVLAWFVVRTAWIGFFRGLSSLAGLLLGFLWVGKIAPSIQEILRPWFKGYPWVPAVSWLSGFMLIFLAVFVVAEILTRIFSAAHLSSVNRILGALLGWVKACLFLSIFFFFVVTFYPQGKDLIQRSVVAPWIFKTTRILVELIPSEWKHKFNYHWRKYFQMEKRTGNSRRV